MGKLRHSGRQVSEHLKDRVMPHANSVSFTWVPQTHFLCLFIKNWLHQTLLKPRVTMWYSSCQCSQSPWQNIHLLTFTILFFFPVWNADGVFGGQAAFFLPRDSMQENGNPHIKNGLVDGRETARFFMAVQSHYLSPEWSMDRLCSCFYKLQLIVFLMDMNICPYLLWSLLILSCQYLFISQWPQLGIGVKDLCLIHLCLWHRMDVD